MRVQMGANNNNDTVGGSALVEMGLTVALATVRGPMACQRRSDELSDRAAVEVSVKAAPFASSGGDRRVANSNTDRRLVEISHLLKRALEATILAQLYPKSKIEVQVVLLADDGGRLGAVINAASVALIDAGIPVKDVLCACSAGYSGQGTGTDETTLVDLNRHEESSFGGQNAICLPCAMLPQRGTVVMAQCEARLPNFDTMEKVLGAAMDGCRAVFDIVQAALRERATLLLGMRNGHGKVGNLFADDGIEADD